MTAIQVTKFCKPQDTLKICGLPHFVWFTYLRRNAAATNMPESIRRPTSAKPFFRHLTVLSNMFIDDEDHSPQSCTS